MCGALPGLAPDFNLSAVIGIWALLGFRMQKLILRIWLTLKLHLLGVQAQCILFRRYPQVLEPFKYAGYPMLLQAVTLSEDDQEAKSFLGPEQAPQLQVLLTFSGSSFVLQPCMLQQGFRVCYDIVTERASFPCAGFQSAPKACIPSYTTAAGQEGPAG